MPRPKVLYVCHNHPAVRPGGAEAYALELYEAMRDGGDFEPIFLAKGGPPMSALQPRAGTSIAPVNGDPGQYFFFTDRAGFDPFFGSCRDKEVYTRRFREFLLLFKPDVVHFQHTWFLGYDMIREVRRTLPDVPIVYTLHEMLPICHRQGQMVRAQNHELCSQPTPQRCHECFPDIPAAKFFLRREFIQSQFNLVDRFTAPSRFLRDRYIAWGIAADRIELEEYGRRSVTPLPCSPEDRPRNRLGFFGQFTTYKGVDVLLRAMIRIGEMTAPTAARAMTANGTSHADAYDAHLWLHGANLELQPGSYQNEVRALLEKAAPSVTMVGRYSHEELPRLMANVDWVIVPSIWWENSPLVIQEAFQYGRPVICSDVGGMAEKVAPGVNGLHFRVGDPHSLAEAIVRAVGTPGLWNDLRRGIPAIYDMPTHLDAMTRLYRELIDRLRGRPSSTCDRELGLVSDFDDDHEAHATPSAEFSS